MIEYYAGTAFPSELKLYSDYVLERALPPLEDLQSKADALERAHADFQRLESFDSPDLNTAARAALAGERYFNESMSLRHMLLTLFVLGLSHLVEQQLARIHAFLTRFDSRPFNDKLPCAAIEAVGVWPRDFKAWPVLTELRCVGNVGKHGGGKPEEGGSAEILRKVRPDLFQHPAIKGQRPENWLLDQPVRAPLTGDDLYLERADFERYTSAALGFWSELAEAFATRQS